MSVEILQWVTKNLDIGYTVYQHTSRSEKNELEGVSVRISGYMGLYDV